jgi:hypothetical protein
MMDESEREVPEVQGAVVSFRLLINAFSTVIFQNLGI